MTEHKPLVELKRRSNIGAGEVFCLPGAGDGITTFMSLVGYMSNDLAVYGLQPAGLVDDQQPYPSFETMVEIYLDVILPKKLKGPCYLIGHSFGGLVALEIARQLMAKNCEVAPLILLDVTPPESPHIYQSRALNILGLVETMEMVSKASFNISFEDLESLSDESQLTLLHKRMVDVGILPKQSKTESIKGMVDVFIANCNMEYWPDNIYEGRAMLINALEDKAGTQERLNKFNKWKQFIPNVEYKESPGNHVTLLGNDNVKTLAKIIEMTWDL